MCNMQQEKTSGQLEPIFVIKQDLEILYENEGQDSFIQLQKSSTLVVVVKTDGSIKEIIENKTPNIKNDGKEYMWSLE